MKSDRLKAAIPGFGATGHLATALFAQEAGAKVDLIPYRGAAPALTDLMGGHVDLFFGTPQQLVQQVATGKVKGYGVTSRYGLPELPAMESLVHCSEQSSTSSTGRRSSPRRAHRMRLSRP